MAITARWNPWCWRHPKAQPNIVAFCAEATENLLLNQPSNDTSWLITWFHYVATIHHSSMQESSPLIRLHSVYQGRLYLIYPSIIYSHDVPNIDCQTSDFMPCYLCEDEVDADGQRSLSLFDTGRAWRPTFCRSKGCQVWPIGIHRYPSKILGNPDRFGPKISIIALLSWRFGWRCSAPGGVELAPEVLFEVLRKYCIWDRRWWALGGLEWMGQLLTAWVTRLPSGNLT